jgi:hypothetical protein
VSARLPVLAGLLLALAGCRSPVGRTVASPALAGLAEPGPPTTASRPAFFQGLADAEGVLARLRAQPSPPGAPPALVPLPDVEAAVRRRFARGAPGGALREAFAAGTSAHFPLPPRRMADLLGHPEAERRSFGADTFRVVATAFELPDASRRTYVVEMLNQGEGPIRFDFRFAMAVERWDLADGSVLLRYDPVPWGGTQHVTLFRGMAVIEPAAGGSLLTEVLVFGSDVRLPFFLRGKLRGATADSFRRRLERLQSFSRGPRADGR